MASIEIPDDVIGAVADAVIDRLTSNAELLAGIVPEGASKDLKRWFTREEAAEYLCQSVSTIDRLSTKRLPKGRVNNRVVYDRADLDAVPRVMPT